MVLKKAGQLLYPYDNEAYEDAGFVYPHLLTQPANQKFTRIDVRE